MSSQTIRWTMAFLATTGLSASLVLSTSKLPAPAVAEAVVRREPASVTEVELELLLNKIREGDLLAQKSDLTGAKRAWQEARRMGEGLWPIHEGLGDSYGRAKLTEDALKEYQLASSLVPDKHAALRQTIAAKRAQLLAAAGRRPEAIQAYLDLNQPGAFGARIAALVLEGGSLDPVLRHAEVYDPRLFKLAALLQMKLSREADAAASLAKFAIRVAPWDDRINQEAIAGLRESKQIDTAIEVCRAWIKAVPQSLDAYQTLGDLLWESGREREAMVAYSSIVDVKPGEANSHRWLGEIYLRRGRPQEAMAQFELGLRAAPQDAELRSRVVPIYLERLAALKRDGKADEVLALRKRLAELNVTEAGLFDLKVVMTWDVQSDVDLDIYEPDGRRVYHANGVSNFGGRYYTDNTQGLGPETYTVAKAAAGKWRVGAHLHGGQKSTVKFLVILFEDTPQEVRREETITLSTTGEVTTFIQDIILP